MYFSKHRLSVQTVLITAFCLAFTFSAAAAEISVSRGTIQEGDILELKVSLNTQGDSINAVEGRINYSPRIASLLEVSTGESIITFWVEDPSKGQTDRISFSGIIPGGYNTSDGELFTLKFKLIREGFFQVDIAGGRALMNNGRGTEVPLSIDNFNMLVNEEVLSTKSEVPSISDEDPPEPFEILLAQDPSIFSGQYFIAFSTSDKISGIDHYEVREGDSQFVVAESPYQLQNQRLDEMVFVRAIDKVGNQYIATLQAQNPKLLFNIDPFYYILGLVALMIATIWIIAEHRRKIKNEIAE